MLTRWVFDLIMSVNCCDFWWPGDVKSFMLVDIVALEIFRLDFLITRLDVKLAD